jgi:superfamily I DNA and/or RNA helicase
LDNRRSELVKFNQAIRARSSGKQADIFDSINPQRLLRAFPVWLVTADTLHRILPLRQELFDLVLIDEATQCNIAAALPALYRAKRALIVGDAK